MATKWHGDDEQVRRGNQREEEAKLPHVHPKGLLSFLLDFHVAVLQLSFL